MVDREKVIKCIDICLQRFHCGEDCPYYDNCGIGCTEQLREDALALLKDQPEIVRCKDCKWYKEGYDINEKWFSRCNGSVRTYGHTNPDWFCADGERR